MTKEEKKFHKLWRNTLTDSEKEDLRLKKREYNKKHYLEHRDVELERKREYSRGRRARLSDEQRLHHNKVQREYNKNNRSKINNIKNKYDKSKKGYECRIKNSYGLTYNDVKQLFLYQNGKCFICKSIFKNKNDMNIDHNHSNGKVRQLLCRSCNRGLGCFYENINSFENALEYLKKWNESPNVKIEQVTPLNSLEFEKFMGHEVQTFDVN